MPPEKLEDLSIDELKHGVTKAIDNAADLISDAELLLDNQRNERACALFQLAIEELGKSKLLFSLILKMKLGKEIDFKKVNRDFTSHQPKSQGSISFEAAVVLIMQSEKTGNVEENKKDFLEHLELLKQEHEFTDILNDFKNKSLYVGLRDKKFVSPKEVVPHKLINKLRTNALVRLKASESLVKYLLNDLDGLIDNIKQVELEANLFDLSEEVLDKFFRKTSS